MSPSHGQHQSLTKQARQYLNDGNFLHASNLYEQLIDLVPNEASHYWYLGLARLLQGQEADAQMAWFIPLSSVDSEQADLYTAELTTILKIEAERYTQLNDIQKAWLICQYVRELLPNDEANLLKLLQLSLDLNDISGLDELLKPLTQVSLDKSAIKLDLSLGINATQQLLRQYPQCLHTASFVEALLLQYPQSPEIGRFLFSEINSIDANTAIPANVVIHFLELCLQYEASNFAVLTKLTSQYHRTNRHNEAIAYSKKLLGTAETPLEQLSAHYLQLRSLLISGSDWQQSQEAFKRCQTEILAFLQQHPHLTAEQTAYLISMTGVSPYFSDTPQSNHTFRQQIAQQYDSSPLASKSAAQRRTPKAPLRIGYLCSCFYRHSVAWLSRWLFKYHNTEDFEIYAYSLNAAQDDLQQFIAEQTEHFHEFSANISASAISEKIQADQIDILVDLDSITSRKSCQIMLLKPAPIQVTWLGSDASGIPTIDYFLADDLVLPTDAQDYYVSKIWRLPQPYIAVDGFEVGVPTLNRTQLDIPQDAIIFLSSQTGYKRHPEMARLQMKIIKQVPNSYYLIRGLADETAVQELFEQIATEEGVSCDRLRFLPIVPTEEIHRANLAIADVVLDTYPYNGATTTLETLWMGIPLVTRVGEQFAARNSYAFMTSAGLTEGIAWTDSEYIEWGVRLGTDLSLRQQITWGLKRSRQTAPLWNARQFTEEMENAYQAMWSRYLEE